MTMRWPVLVLAVITALLAPVAARPVAAQVPSAEDAAAAWDAGDNDRARGLYAARVAADSGDVRALHRLGLLLAWNREYDRALPLLHRLVALAPSTAARTDLANVLAWDRQFDAALDVLDGVMRDDPSRAALHTRARFLSWAGRYDRAEAAYRALLEEDPSDAEALRGLARVTTWRGDLGAGEGVWRRAVAAEPENADARIGLSQVLRWSGRPRGALEEARAAVRVRPGDRDALEQLAWAEAAFAPRIAPTLSAEYDSDDNRLFTAALTATVHPVPRVALSAHGYFRRAEHVGPAGSGRETRSLLASARVDAGSGWMLNGGAGAVGRPVGGTAAIYRAGFASPAWLPVSASIGYGRSVLDATADLMGRDITTDEATATLAGVLSSRLRAEAGVALTRYNGQQTNDRVLGRLGLEARAAPWLRLRPRVTAFVFDETLQEGYFSPDEYVLAELGVGIDRHRGAWGVSAEMAPGAQRIGSAGDFQGALSARLRVGYTFAPGRDIGLTLSFSNLGIERFEPGSAGYRYQAAVLSAGWGL
ncbi:MAG TPA: tetratricopeptide repeat protein [Longimicrobiales bacterium]|nr:tetratricopeptide repeat protein [Longimicrobiales bacterium]